MFGFFNFKMFNSSRNPINWEELKKEGRVTETKSTKDGIVTITRTFVSFDNSENFEEMESFPEDYQKHQELTKLKSDLKNAQDKEDYEQCIVIKKQIDTLLGK